MSGTPVCAAPGLNVSVLILSAPTTVFFLPYASLAEYLPSSLPSLGINGASESCWYLLTEIPVSGKSPPLELPLGTGVHISQVSGSLLFSIGIMEGGPMFAQ